MELLEIAMLGRILERVSIVFVAGLSLWIGGSLFKSITLPSDQQATFEYNNLIIKLHKVGPGIFFALFGAAILIFAVISPLEITNEKSPTSANVKIKYLKDIDRVELERWTAALTTSRNISKIPAALPIPQPDRKLIASASDALIEMRSMLLTLQFSETDVSIWLEWKDKFRETPQSVPESLRGTVARVNKAATASYMEYVK